MDFSAIFTAYYSLFRADSDVPTSTDDEYTVGLRLANEAINYWANYDGTYWKELFSTNQTDGTGDQTIVTSQRVYDAPTNFREAGGFVKVLDSDGNEQQRYPVIDPQEVQFKDANSTFCYFTGNNKDGYFLNINPAPASSLNGKDIEYDYYKTPTQLTIGTSKTEMANPYFIVHRMLGMQFRAARNPYYSSAIKDAENAIRTMQLDNNSGSWANPWSQADNSGSVFGV